MGTDPVEMRIAALLDHADVEQARVREAITELRATGVALQKDVAGAAGQAVKVAFEGLQGDIERARGSMKWFSYRWFFITVATLAGLGALTSFAMWASLAWQRHELNGLLEQKAALAADIAQMQVDAAALAKKGARIKIADCGGRCASSRANTSPILRRTGMGFGIRADGADDGDSEWVLDPKGQSAQHTEFLTVS